MKKVIFGLIATVVFGLNGNAQTLGNEHNRFLGVLLTEFQAKCKVDPTFMSDKEKIAVVLYSKSVAFFQDSKFVTNKSNLEEGVAELILAANGVDDFNLSQYNYTDKQKSFMSKILTVFDKKLGYDAAMAEINAINLEAKTACNSEEYKVIASVVDIAINSSDYAYHSIVKWKNLSGNVVVENLGDFDWGAVVKADVKGFIKGLIFGKPLEKAAIDSCMEIIKQIFF